MDRMKYHFADEATAQWPQFATDWRVVILGFAQDEDFARYLSVDAIAWKLLAVRKEAPVDQMIFRQHLDSAEVSRRAPLLLCQRVIEELVEPATVTKLIARFELAMSKAVCDGEFMREIGDVLSGLQIEKGL